GTGDDDSRDNEQAHHVEVSCVMDRLAVDAEAEQLRRIIRQHLGAFVRVRQQRLDECNLPVVIGLVLELRIGPVAAPEEAPDATAGLAYLRQYLRRLGQVGLAAVRGRQLEPYAL